MAISGSKCFPEKKSMCVRQTDFEQGPYLSFLYVSGITFPHRVYPQGVVTVRIRSGY